MPPKDDTVAKVAPTTLERFLEVPAEVIYDIGRSYEGSTLTMSRLSRTSKAMRALFQPELDERAAKQLLEYVLQGEFTKAQKMYIANPRLLFRVVKDEVESPAAGWDAEGKVVRRKVKNRSPLQAAAAGVNKMIYDDMLLYIHLAVDINTNQPIGMEHAKAFAAQQLNAQFPNGFAYPPSEYDVDKEGLHFSTLLKAITNDTELRQEGHYNPNRKPNETTKAALAEFREYFRPKEAVDSGHDFNLNHLVKAYELYQAHWRQWNWNQCVLFCVEAIGYLQGLVPASVAQAFCQGLYYLLDQKQLPELVTDVKIWGAGPGRRVAFYPRDSAAAGTASEILGKDFLVDIIYGGGGPAPRRFGVAWGRAVAGGRHPAAGVDLLKNYVEQTRQALTALSNTLNSHQSIVRSGPSGSA